MKDQVSTDSTTAEKSPVTVDGKTASGPFFQPVNAAQGGMPGGTAPEKEGEEDTVEGGGASSSVNSALPPGEGTDPNSNYILGTGSVVSGGASGVEGVGPAPVAQRGLITDGMESLQPGQQDKASFLSEVEKQVRSTVADALKNTSWSPDNCPWIARWMDFYRRRSAASLEESLSRYIPQSSSATSASDYIAMITDRIRPIAVRWAATGKIEGLPSELSGTFPPNESVAASVLQQKSETPGSESNVRDPAVIRQRLGEGRSMSSDTQGRMESAFGTSFSDVRIHTGEAASALSSELRSRAFTVGNQIAFAGGEYQPGSMVGDALIAHELAHVQQQRGMSEVAPMSKGDTAYNSLEKEADGAAVSVVARLYDKTGKALKGLSGKVMTSLKSGLRLQSCGSSSIQSPVGVLKIDLFTTTNMEEQPVNPGEAITSDFPSFVARLNYRGESFPRVVAFRMVDSLGKDVYVRYPDQTGISRMPMVPVGDYTVIGEVVMAQGQQPVPLTREVSILPSYKTLLATQGPGDLAAQKPDGLDRSLINTEEISTRLRSNAVIAAGVPNALADAWNVANQQAILMEGVMRSNGTITPAMDASTRTAFSTFYRLMRDTVKGDDVVHTVTHSRRGPGGEPFDYDTVTVSNKYITANQTSINMNAVTQGGATTQEWKSRLDGFYEVTGALNAYTADKLEAAGIKESAAQMNLFGPLSIEYRKLYRDHPDAKPVKAVFYPKLQSELKDTAKPGDPHQFPLNGIPQRMYTYREGNEWHLMDLTRADHGFNSHETGGTATDPPRELITGLDSSERFPEGIMYWQFEGGKQDSCEMTHPMSVSEALNIVAAMLAFAGMAALVLGTGGAAAPLVIPTVCFVASGLVGAAGAAVHIHESDKLGTLTPQSYAADAMSIAVNLLAAGTAGLGHIVKAAQTAETAWTGFRAFAAIGAQAIYRPVQLAGMAADAASLVMFTQQASEQFDQIMAMPPGPARNMAMTRLAAQSLMTGGMTLMSIKGGMHEVSQGQSLYLDFATINGSNKAIAIRVLPEAELLSHARIAPAKTEAEAFLKRTDIDPVTMDRFKGELSAAISTPGVSADEIKSFIREMNGAAATDTERLLVQFRSNRTKMAIGGVSHSAGYDLSYLHTSVTDFQAMVGAAFKEEGALAHNSTLSHVEGADPSVYNMKVKVAGGATVNAEVTIGYSDFSKESTSAIGGGTATTGSTQGPARNGITWDETHQKWKVKVDVDQHLAPGDIRRAVGHELDESADVINRLNDSPDKAVGKIKALQEPGLFAGGNTLTSHDYATLREIDRLLAGRGSNPASGATVTELLQAIGITTESKQMRNRLELILKSDAIDESRKILLEGWVTYDTAVARGSRIAGMSREAFLKDYEEGWRFDEGGSSRWYKIESERGPAVRQFFTADEMASPNKAFDRLAGPASESSFKPYYDALIAKKLASKAEVMAELQKLMKTSKGGDLDFVRHQLKEKFRGNIISYVTNKARLAKAYPGKTFEEASHTEMMDLTKDLNSSDKGSLAEDWYQQVFAPNASAHVMITGASGKTRFPDLVLPDGTLQDLKYIEGKLSDRELSQFNDNVLAIGSDVSVSGANGTATTVNVKRVRYAFLNPKGVKENAMWMNKNVTGGSAVTFEIFNSQGERRIVNASGIWDTKGSWVGGLDLLTDEAQLSAWLKI